jgi:hypothetical protein
MHGSPVAHMVCQLVSFEKENSAVLHWDVKKFGPLLVALTLVALAAFAGCLSWVDGALGIYW